MAQNLTTQELKQYFTGDYVNDYPKMPIFRLSRLVPHFTLNKEDSVVDYACGSGMLLEVIHDKVGQYTGVDFSAEFIQLATRTASLKGYTNAHFESGDIIDFAAKHAKQFDKAFTMDFAECVYDTDFTKIFKAVWDSLKPGGTLYYHEPNGAFFLERLRDLGVISRYTQVVAVRTAPRIQKLLEAVGFTDVKVKMLPHYLKPLSYLHPLSYLPWIGKLFEARIFLYAKRPE